MPEQAESPSPSPLVWVPMVRGGAGRLGEGKIPGGICRKGQPRCGEARPHAEAFAKRLRVLQLFGNAFRVKFRPLVAGWPT